MSDARQRAIAVLTAVLKGEGSLTGLLPPAEADLDDRERRLLQALCYTTLRHGPTLQGLLDQLLKKPFRARDQDLRAVLLLGAAQLLYLRVPDHAAIHESVAACQALKKGWARKLVNGVLRQLQRRHNSLTAHLSPAQRAACPDWLYAALGRDWPDARETILAASNDHPPFCLRVNQARISRDAYQAQLADLGMDATPCRWAGSGLRLNAAVDVDRLPGFWEGLVSVQDEAAQLVPTLLAPDPHHRVLDACAAPGGKTAHLLETWPTLAVTAVDSDEARLQRLGDTLARLAQTADVRLGDACVPATWWEGEPFDRILLDAPCSATGVIRRHPDIKWLRRADDIPALAEQQGLLLDALWPLLRPGGHLLYVTCSLLRAENHAVIRAFLDREPTARCMPITADWGEAAPEGRQLLPAIDGPDGFFFSRLEKTA